MEIQIINTTISIPNELSVSIYKPIDNNKYPCVIFCHGLASSKKEFFNIPKLIAEKGYVCITFDYSGHGESKGAIGYISKYSHLEDTKQIIELAKSYDFINKDNIFLLGHSLGTAAVLRYIVEIKDNSIKGIILCAPVDKISYSVPVFQRILYFVLYLLLYPLYTFFKIHIYIHYSVTLNDLFFNRESISKARKENFLLKYLPIANYPYLLREINNSLLAKNINIPSLVILGEKDKIVSNKHSKKVFEELKGKKEIHILSKTGHSMFIDNEVKLLEVILKWLQANLT